MRIDELATLYDYGYWANQWLFEALQRLTPDEYTRPVAGSYGSIRNTLVHTMSAEWGWLERCGGARRGPALDPNDYPTVQSLIARWAQVEQELRSFLATLGDADLLRVVDFTLGGGPRQAMRLGELMHHAATHAVHHRGQVALLLRVLGQVPGNFDLLIYYGGRQPASSR